MTEFTATAQTLTNGRRLITFARNGVVEYTITTKVAAYAWVNVQGWDHTEDVAFRLSRSPKPLGARIEYGHVIANIEITEA
jgi:hypothetical protein